MNVPRNDEFGSAARERVYLHPFDNAIRLIRDRESGGGMGTVFQALTEQRARMIAAGTPLHDHITVMSFDEGLVDMEEAGLTIKGADAKIRKFGFGEFYAHLYDDKPWNIVLHPHSVTSEGQDEEALQKMFPLECEGTRGELAFADNYFGRYGAAAKFPGIENEVEQLFAPMLDDVPDKSIVHWSMHSILPAMHNRADMLRARGVYQTYHHHFPQPTSLHQTEIGRMALIAQSKMDAVYFHTDADVRSFLDQVEILGLRMPTHVGRFNLGIDTATLKADSEHVNRGNYDTAIRSFSALDEDQKDALRKLADAQHRNIPHQFICIDRIDAHKGIGVLLKGIESYLDSLDMTNEQMRAQYKFFFFHELFNIDDQEEGRPRLQYAQYVKDLYTRIREKFPDVVHVSNSIPKDAIPWALRGRTLLNASPHDGKNLACMEAAYVNSLDDTSTAGLMIGSGTGFAVQLKEDGLDHLVTVAKAGDVESIAASLREIVLHQKNDPRSLQERIRELVEKAILPQNDTLFPDPIEA